ncbi:glycosyltransferase family 2 protein [Calditrichota bacterium]
MKISIIIPYFNGVQQLPETLKALQKVSLRNETELEIIVSDDGSSILPDSLVPAELKHSVKVIHQNHKGQSACTNFAVKHASGEYLWLLAQDIKAAPECLDNFIDTASRFPDGLMQGVIFHDPALLEDRFTKYVAEESPFQFAFDRIADDNDLPPTFHFAPNAFVNREFFMEMGGYYEDLPYGFQDTDFAIRWRLSGKKIVLVRNSIVYHNHHFQFDAYFSRQYRIGKSAVDLFVKWEQEAELIQFSNLIRIFVIKGEIDSQIAIQAINRWQISGEEPPQTLVPDAKEPALNACFNLVLRREFYRGIYDRIRELYLHSHLLTKPEEIAVFNFDNPFNWIGRMLSQEHLP